MALTAAICAAASASAHSASRLQVLALCRQPLAGRVVDGHDAPTSRAKAEKLLLRLTREFDLK
jgi:hypothetical protein